MKGYHFLDEQGTFELDMPENYSYQYFPVAGEKGIKSALTPNFGGDSKRNQNEFLLEPVSVENLHNNRSSRNFWCHMEGRGNWSVTGASAQAEQAKFTDAQDKSKMTAGLMWQSVTRTSSEYQMEAKVTSFVPVDHDVEIMYVELTNCGIERIEFVPVAAIPIYARSADNIRDHRHVTSLLHRIFTREEGVVVVPTLSFDERGHQTNEVCYYACGVSGDGSAPEAFYPTVEDYIGEGGSYTAPRAVIENYPGVPAGGCVDGKEAMGGMKFARTVLAPGEHTSFTILLGATDKPEEIAEIVNAYRTAEKTESAFAQTKDYWQEKVNIGYHTGSKEFDNFMRWVSFQPVLRRIYGCSFLPHHDYGKGGRGWRDLWQDCLALLLMNPDGVRQMLLDNFGGVRMDGTNATIIGAKQGEFIADRNNITRVWMDHGVWPFMTTRLYIDQTGDVEILEKKVPYFKDKQVERGTATDEQWSDEYGSCQKDGKGLVYHGTVFEHLLLQNLCAFYEVGEHNHCRLRGADWNDALDMAQDRGESVAFTNAYAGNLRQLAEYLLLYQKKTGKTEVFVAEEMLCLLNVSKEKYDSRDEKEQILIQYGKSCRHTVSGKTVSVEISGLARNLQEKADWMMNHIRLTEWVTDQEQNGWFNGYYDNHGRQVDGVNERGVRMMLTGQVFAIMGGTATKEQISSISLYQDDLTAYANQWSTPWYQAMAGEVPILSADIQNYADDSVNVWDAEQFAEATEGMDTTEVFAFGLPSWGVLTMRDNVQDTSGKWGVCSGPAYGFGGGTFIGISSQSERKDLAWDFLKFCTLNEDTANWWIEVSEGDTVSLIPVLEAHAEDANEVYGGQQLYKFWLEQAEGIDYSKVTRYDKVIGDAWGSATTSIKTGEKTKEEALEEFYDVVESTYPEITVNR